MATKLTKRQQAFQTALADVKQPTSATEGVAALLNAINGTKKFDESIEMHMRLGINMKHADQQIRTTCALPEGTGKVVRVAVIAKGEKVAEANAAGADFAGSEDLIERMEQGFFDFDVLIATPDMMVQVGKLGKILGPRGLMPNPKTGTVTFNVAEAIKSVKAGQVEIRPDKQAVLHVVVGKSSFTPERVVRNILAVYDTVQRAKPAAAKGTFMLSVYLTSTMGPSLQLDPSALNAQLKTAGV